MHKTGLTDLIRGYENSRGGKKFAVLYITGNASRATQSRTARKLSELAARTSEVLNFTSTRAYGFFFLSFGILTLIIQLAKGYMSPISMMSVSEIIIGSIFTILAIPFVVLDIPLTVALQKFPLTEFIFFDFFCLAPPHIKKGERNLATIPAFVGIMLGSMAATIGAFVPVWYVLFGIVGITYLYLSLNSPEFSFFFTFLIIPYLPLLPSLGDYVLAAMVAITIFSYLRKVISGKRVYFFEQYDMLLILLLTFVFITGVFVKGMDSFTSSLLMIILSMGYVLTGSLVTNRRIADCVIKAVVASSVPVSVIAIIQAIREVATYGVLNFDGVSSTFDHPGTLAVLLLISAAFSLYFIFVRRSKKAKILYTVILVLTVFATFLTMQFWAFVAALIGALAYAVLKIERYSGFIIGALTLLPYVILCLPSRWLMTLANIPLVSALGLSDIAPIWINSRRIFINNVFSGIGIGTDSFMSEYAGYAGGVNVAPNSSNFLLQIACEAGVFALILFVAFFIVRLVHRTIYIPYIKNSRLVLLNNFSSISMVVLMVYGISTSLWSDMTMYFLFWCVLGLGSGALRISKQEFDERVAYFSDGAGADASSIDISIR